MKLTYFPWVVGTIGGLLSSPLMPVLSPLWGITVALLLATVCVALQKLPHIISKLVFAPLNLQSFYIIDGCKLLGGVLCGMSWVIFNLSMQFSWQLDHTHWREPTRIHLQVESLAESDDLRTRLDGCLTQAPTSWQIPNRACPLKVRVYWYADERPKVRAGETWSFVARLKPSAATLNPGLFDYQKYLARHRIRLLGSVTEGKKLSSARALSVAAMRQHAFEALEQERDELGYAGLILALGLGERQWLTTEQWDTLRRTGLSHVVAISGLHLSLVFTFCILLLKRCVSVRWLSKWSYFHRHSELLNRVRKILIFASGFALAFFYAALAGFPITTLRALILILVVGFAMLSREHSGMLKIWFYAVLLILWLDPLAYLDTGFWLSICAVLSIFVWHWRERVASSQNLVRKWQILWRFEVMLLIMLLPVSILFFQGIAWLAPVTNVLLIPVFTALLIPITLISIVASWFWPQLANTLWWLLDKVYQAMFSVLDRVAAAEFAWFEVWDPFWGWWLFASVLCCYLPFRFKYKVAVFVTLVIFAALYALNKSSSAFAIHVLDVGQGNAIVIEQGGRSAVIDTGPAYHTGYSAGASTVIPFLKRRGLILDWGVVSHQHLDHSGGQAALQEAFPNALWLDNNNAAQGCYFGQHWRWQEVTVRVLAPLPGPRFGQNNDSCVISVEYQNQRVLLPGDSGYINELRLYGRYQDMLKHDILLVSHHGSKRSSQPEFLDAVAPDIAVVSRGFANQFGMPNQEVLARYANRNIDFYDTGRHGQVSLLFKENEWQVRLARPLENTPWFHQLPAE
ncbi:MULTISPECIES: DNA internalization-related competence protein ComEC/Rec2 [Gammaproteobacteria]|uniref:DNA internalization-related competence protein ComEC/Rec2 n=1 Tax=Gammaproteobacteria TaxID=1236 RepID=UPI000DD00F25|nr:MULTISPECIES: DNA internalization-related competence protein ComEC/Rec2 [Gammaproteobacteria]RTE86944.1 DNA internalization-related competence protein ComEC/Rec2 [Aliidiomarina sp. B3213]TCZ93266.1 DNA internalization-related competence protein ComEC/Rec2 [Lysobacter sp. N42]